jgi:hypothetical protein
MSHLVATVEGKTYAYFWQKNPPQAETAPEPAVSNAATATSQDEPAPKPEPPKVAKVIKVIELGIGNDGYTGFKVLTLTNDQTDAEGISAKFIIGGNGIFETARSIHLGDIAAIETDAKGQKIVRLRPFKPGEITLHFWLENIPVRTEGPFQVTREEEVPVPLETATPATDAEKNLPEIEVVNPPRDPDATTGTFVVNVVTRQDGKKTDRDFTAFCDQAITVQQKTPAGLADVSTFTADSTGQYQLYVGFTGIMVKIVFRLDNGKEAEVWLRK